MSRVLVFGMGPLRWEQSIHLFALGIRTWHCARTLAAAGHSVCLVSLRKRAGEGWPVDKVTRVSRDGVTVYSISEHAATERPELVWRIVESFGPEAVVGVNTHPAAAAVGYVGELPFWADINGDPMAEAQARAAVYDDDFSIVDWYGRLALLLRRADRFSTCSERQRMALYGQLGVHGRLTGDNDGWDFVTSIPNGLDAEEREVFAAIRRAPRGRDDPFVVLGSGGYNTWADPDTLFSALDLAMGEERAIQFLSIGGSIAGHDDRTFAHFRKRVARSRHEERFRFAGWVLTEELAAYYQSAHAAIVVDRWTIEGLLGARTRMLDWLAAGLPITCTRMPEISSWLDERGLALTAQPGDAEGLARALIRLVREPGLTADMAERGRQLVETELASDTLFAPLVRWADNPRRAPDGDRVVPLPPPGRLATIRKNASLFSEQVKSLGLRETLKNTALYASRQMRNRTARLRSRFDVGSLERVPEAESARPVAQIAPRFGPDEWRRRARAWDRAPSVVVVLHVPRDSTPDVLEWTVEHLRRQYYESLRILLVPGRDADEPLRELVAKHADDLAAAGREVEVFESPEAWSGSLMRHESIVEADWVGMMSPGVLLSPDAVAELVDAAVAHDADAVYADETSVDETSVSRPPFCKPGWSPDFLLSVPYLGQPVLYRTSIARECGDFQLDGLPRELDFELALRVTEHTERVHHVPRVLCRRWSSLERPLGDRLAEERALAEAEERSLGQAIWRRRLEATVERGTRAHTFRVRYEIRSRPKVSVIIPTRDRVDLLRPCLESLETRTTWSELEVLIVDNGSTDSETLDYLAACPHQVHRFDEPFNFSRLNNKAARLATGEHLLLLNNDTEVITPGWMEAMLEHSQRPEVGAVGAKLLWPDGTIQHAGIAYMPSRVTYAHGRLRDVGQDAFSDVVRNFSAVTAACMMMRRSLYLDLGGLDERFAVAYNDVDLCFRLRRRGLLVVYTPHAVLYHRESSSRGYGKQPRQDDDLLESRWLTTLEPDPYLGSVGLRE